MLHESASTTELLSILFISALCICALCAIVVKEKEESEIFKNWRK